MTLTITLTISGSDTGPFDLYSDVDLYVTPFATGVSRTALIAGYTTVAPDGTNTVRLVSTGICTNSIYISVIPYTTTTTSSTSTSTTTTTTTAVPTYTVNFVINDTSYSTCTPNDTLAGSVTDGTTVATISGSPQSYQSSFEVEGAFNFDTSLLELHCSGGGIVSPMYIKYLYGVTSGTTAIFNVNPVVDNMWVYIWVSDADNIT